MIVSVPVCYKITQTSALWHDEIYLINTHVALICSKCNDVLSETPTLIKNKISAIKNMNFVPLLKLLLGICHGDFWSEEDSVPEGSFWTSGNVMGHVPFCNLEQKVCLSAGAAVSPTAEQSYLMRACVSVPSVQLSSDSNFVIIMLQQLPKLHRPEESWEIKAKTWGNLLSCQFVVIRNKSTKINVNFCGQVPENCVDGRWRWLDSRDSSCLSRSRSMDVLPQREPSGTRALCALFESKASLQLERTSAAGSKTGRDWHLQDSRSYSTAPIQVQEVLFTQPITADGKTNYFHPTEHNKILPLKFLRFNLFIKALVLVHQQTLSPPEFERKSVCLFHHGSSGVQVVLFKENQNQLTRNFYNQ